MQDMKTLALALFLLASPALAQPQQPPLVVTAPARPHTFKETLEALGTLRANESVTLTAKVTEQVQSIHFDSGQTVKAGDTLVELTEAEESAQLAAARAGLAEAEQQYARVADLVKGGNVSKSQLDTRTAARDSARARVEEIEARLADRLIKAPFGGIVGLRRISPGQLVQPGEALLTLDDISRLKLDFTVPDVALGKLQPGQKVTAATPAFAGQAFTGQVTAVDSRIDPATRAVTVRALLDNPDLKLRPGMLMQVAVTVREQPGLAVQEQAIVPEGTKSFVFGVANGKAARREVVTGLREPGLVEIKEGLQPGEAVITEGTMRARDGQAVSIKGK